MRKKPRKLKECKYEWCSYCQRYIKKANQYIAMENREIQEYNTKRENAPNSSSNHDDDIIMKEEDTTKEIKESSTNPNINDYERIKVQGGGNCAFRAILTTAGIKAEEWLYLRKLTAQKIKEYNWEKDVLEALNYSSSEELANKIENSNCFVGYEELTPLIQYYDIKCYIYLSDDKYKKNKWITINDKESNTQQESIKLWLHQGTHPELEGHYDALINENNHPIKFKEKLQKDIQAIKLNEEHNKPEVNIMLWNCDSLGSYAKRSYLIEQLYTNDIQIAIIQETMLIKEDKLYMKGYKTFRAEGNIRRKGVLSLVSDQLDCITYKTIKDDEHGRFLQIKLKNNKGTGEILLNNIYLEPDNPNKEIIPEEIWQSEHICGDLNQLKTGYEKIANVYHIKNMGKIERIIKIPNKISDHPIVILKLTIPITMKEPYEKINIQDIDIIQENNKSLHAITREEKNITFKDPDRVITRKRHQIKLSNEDLAQHFDKLKQQEKDKIKELKQKKSIELNQILNSQTLGKEPYQRMASLMQLNTGITWWKAENNNEKELVINGFKVLYRHENRISTNPNGILKLMQELMELLINDINTINLQPPCIPKSRAKD